MKNKINKIINCIVIMGLVFLCLTQRNQIISLKKQLNLTNNKTVQATKIVPKIIYKDKIVYKKDPIDAKIIYQTKMFLKLRLEANMQDTHNYYSSGVVANNSFNYTQIVALEQSKNAILYDMILYNKAFPNGGK